MKAEINSKESACFTAWPGASIRPVAVVAAAPAAPMQFPSQSKTRSIDRNLSAASKLWPSIYLSQGSTGGANGR